GGGKNSSTGKRADAAGQCFTCGVDSFHTLVNNLNTVSHLIFVCGYDIPLHLEKRMQATHFALKEIAEYYNKKLIVVRTNLREHSIFKGVNWEHAHGGALAAVGHLLSDNIGQIIIPSTYMHLEQKAWGSTAETDPLWSSDRLQIKHFGAALIRPQKIKSIVNEPLAKKHLRVCWEMRNSWVNCSECEKCIRTMLGISLCAPVQDFVQFDHSQPLEKRIDSLPFITRHTYPYYRDFLESGLDEKYKEAIKRLIQRSQIAA
ncbi:MAG: hypothetical protein R3297_01710, partial [Desulfobulbales bacterium]|nr:hypothetical protein [Desulfobulbales bacterium]